MLVLDLYWSIVDIQYKQSFGGVPSPDPCKSHPGLPVPLPAWSFLLFKHIRVLHLAFFSPHGIFEINLCISWCACLCLVIVFRCMASPFVCWWMLLGWFLVLGYYEKAAMCIHFCGQIFLFVLNRCRSNGSWDNAFLIYKKVWSFLEWLSHYFPWALYEILCLHVSAWCVCLYTFSQSSGWIAPSYCGLVYISLMTSKEEPFKLCLLSY